MMNRLTPEQISQFWNVIRNAIEQSMPPIANNEEGIIYLLSAALSGRVEIWASYNKVNEVPKFEGIVVTKVLFDEVSNTKNLLIYCLYGYTEVSKNSWLEGCQTLAKYAKSINCKEIVAYSKNPHIINIVKKLGGNTDFTFLSFDVDRLFKF